MVRARVARFFVEIPEVLTTYTQLYFTTKCDSKKKQNKDRT